MASQIRFLVLLSMMICLASVALANQGISRFYDPPYTPSACYKNQDKGAMVGGANPTLYNNRKICGRRYRVKCLAGNNTAPHPCKRGEVIVTMVDLCPGCGPDGINLSRDAFARIASLNAGRVLVDYTPV